jgi:shikimate dehydrogenase
MQQIRLGLIGDKIARSRSPDLHRLAGELCGLNIRYDRLIPPDRGETFDEVFSFCSRSGYRGINVTYPYKEMVVRHLAPLEESLRRLGACNTVVFQDDGPTGSNTDFTGFAAAFRNRFPGSTPGVVAMAGAGGVGKAIAFALAELGATELRLCDPDVDKASALAAALGSVAQSMGIVIAPDMAAAAEGADGVINATPLGMDGVGGNAVPSHALVRQDWAFDAVYTPEVTPFLAECRAKDIAILSGFELFLFQGIDAFRIFTGEHVDPDDLRFRLAKTAEQSAADHAA